MRKSSSQDSLHLCWKLKLVYHPLFGFTFLCFRLCWVFVAEHRLSRAASWLLSRCGAPASHRRGFPLQSRGSRHAGFSSCGVRGLSCPGACRTFPRKGLKLRPSFSTWIPNHWVTGAVLRLLSRSCHLALGIRSLVSENELVSPFATPLIQWSRTHTLGLVWSLTAW